MKQFRGSKPGGGQVSAGGCFSADTMIWTKNESTPDTYVNEIMVKDVIEGHLVGTLDTSVKNAGHYKFIWTRATDVTIYHKICKSHNFSFSSDRYFALHTIILFCDGLKEQNFETILNVDSHLN